MQSTLIRTITPADLPQVMALQHQYAQLYPGAAVIPGEIYLSPGFQDGQNVFCAFEPGGRLLAYAPLFAPLVAAENAGPAAPLVIWTEIKAGTYLAAPGTLKDQLLEQVISRVRQITQPFPGRPAHLTFQYLPCETAGIDYVLSKGGAYSRSAFQMHRDLAEAIPPALQPAGIDVRRWRMESESEQRAYVLARNEAFPEAPVTLAEWQFFLQSPQWSVGTSITAFDGTEVVGSVLVYWDTDENERLGQQAGYTENIFVRPQWRKRGIARGLILEGLAYLQEHGLQEARLEVAARNVQALGLYHDLGYRVVQESRMYVLEL